MVAWLFAAPSLMSCFPEGTRVSVCAREGLSGFQKTVKVTDGVPSAASDTEPWD